MNSNGHYVPRDFFRTGTCLRPKRCQPTWVPTRAQVASALLDAVSEDCYIQPAERHVGAPNGVCPTRIGFFPGGWEIGQRIRAWDRLLQVECRGIDVLEIGWSGHA